MRAVSLHPDVIVVTSALLALNCVIVRGELGEGGGVAVAAGGSAAEGPAASGQAETFVIDSPVLPDELDALPTLLAQAAYPAPSGLLATHADWDHLLGPLAFPGVPLGCPQSSAERLAAEPGVAQRELRAFDEGLYLQRSRPLALGAPQALPVPGRCDIGDHQLELHLAEGHTGDGMAVWVPWARLLIAGDYLSSIEIPTISGGGGIAAYRDTLERLRPLVAAAEHVVPGHGPLLDSARALAVLDEDLAYLQALGERGPQAELPAGRRSRGQRRLHEENVAAVTSI